MPVVLITRTVAVWNACLAQRMAVACTTRHKSISKQWYWKSSLNPMPSWRAKLDLAASHSTIRNLNLEASGRSGTQSAGSSSKYRGETHRSHMISLYKLDQTKAKWWKVAYRTIVWIRKAALMYSLSFLTAWGVAYQAKGVARLFSKKIYQDDFKDTGQVPFAWNSSSLGWTSMATTWNQKALALPLYLSLRSVCHSGAFKLVQNKLRIYLYTGHISGQRALVELIDSPPFPGTLFVSGRRN